MIDRFKAVPLIPQRKTSTPPEKQRKSKSSTILKYGVQRFQPFIVGAKFYTWEKMREYASRTALLFKTMRNESDFLENSDDKTIDEMVDILESLPDKEKWFLNLDDLRLSPKVLRNWYEYYADM